MLIKASGITNLTDARYFAAKEVDFLGFNLEENTEGYLDPMHMKAIREWVEGPKVVGEFTHASTHYVREAAAFFNLDAVQVPATSHGTDWSVFEGLPVIATLKGETPDLDRLLQEKSPFVQYFLIDITGVIDPETGTVPQPDTWKKRCATYPVLVRAHTSAERWSSLIETLQPAGIDLTGGEEERVGDKSFDEIEEILEELGM